MQYYFRGQSKKMLFHILSFLMTSLFQIAIHRLGSTGETVASLYLQKLGYSLLERNVKLGKYELDLVMYDRREKMIVFIEVKTRSKSSEQYPIRTALSREKRSALQRGMARWVSARRHDGPARLDLICVHGSFVTEHIQSIGSDFF